MDEQLASILQMPKGRPKLTVNHDYIGPTPSCRHLRVSVDAHARRVQCRDCKVDLDAIGVLARYSNEESRLMDSVAAHRKTIEILATKEKFQCAHCRRWTKLGREKALAITPDGLRADLGSNP